MKMAHRLRMMDIAKGIAIILVVIGHAIPDASTHNGIASPGLKIIYDMIYSFHMPLFFLISGYFVNTLISKTTMLISIKKKFQRLLFPYIFVGLCYAPCKLLLSRFANDPFHLSNLWKMLIGINPDGELWFLYSLFVISTFSYLMRVKVGKLWIICSGIIGGGTLCLPVVISNVLFFQFFFFFGIYLKQNNPNWIQNISKGIFIVCFLLWGLLNIPYHYGSVLPVKLFTGIFGSICILYLSNRLEDSSSLIVKGLEVAGKYCMEIYILSDIVKIPLRILFWSKLHMYYLAFIACSIMDVILPIIMKQYIIRRWKWLNLFCFGEK